MLSRRQFLKLSAIAGASVAVPWKLLSDARPVQAFSQSTNLRKFIQPLRGVGGTGIPVAQPDSGFRGWWQPGVTHYTIDLSQFEDQLHPNLPNPTRLWGYGQNGIFKHLGGIIAVKRGTPVQITFRNNLPLPHILPVDDTIMGVMGNQNNRANTHLHGGFVPWVSDGGPHAWWDPNGHRGLSFVNVLNPHLQDNEAEIYYPNDQSARLMWYHDHTFGTTRLNAYAGLATGYVIYDDFELGLTNAPYYLPGPFDPRTIYMVFQDKIFVQPNIETTDPTWSRVVPNSRAGDLWYAHIYDTARYGALGPNPLGLPPDPSCVPEYFGDTMLVNGTVFPTLTVEPRQYRFRMLNACQARFLNPRLVYAQGSSFPANTEPSPNAAGPAFVQIGTEGGFLPQLAKVNGPKQPLLVLAPAERADLIVDFRNVKPGSFLILYSDAPAPYPMGDARNDYYPGNPKTPSSIPGYGPNTRTLLQIYVAPLTGSADAPITFPATFTDGIAPLLTAQTSGVPTANPANVPVRNLTLNETFDGYGRLIQKLGSDFVTSPAGAKPLQFGLGYLDATTENVSAGSTEVWQIANLTGDVHPIHFHLVNVQVLSRQAFSASQYTGGTPNFQGPVMAPDDNELGWKETVRMFPGQVTRVLMKFDLPNVPFNVPPSPRTGGFEYVWHCHILEHEEHDMMRPLVVT